MSDRFIVVEQIFAEFRARHASPGMVVAVGESGETVHLSVHGVARIATDSAAASDLSAAPETAFRIASMTKSFAAAVTLALRDEGLLELDRPLEAVVSHLPLDPFFRQLTVRQLLSMTADLPTDDAWADRWLGVQDEELTRLFAAPALAAGLPCGAYSYSNFAYMLLGAVLHCAAGAPAMNLIRERLLEPLGLAGTVWIPLVSHDVAAGYVRRGERWIEEPQVVCRGDGAVFGGLWSCVGDIIRWMEFLRAAPEEPAAWSGVLSQESRRELSHPYVRMPALPYTLLGRAEPERQHADYGFGLRAFRLAGESFVGHSGGLPGYGSHMRWSPQTGLSIVALSNATYTPVWDPCTVALEALVRPLRRAAPLVDRTRLTESCRGVIELLWEWDDERANVLFTSTLFDDYPRDELKRDLARVAAGLDRLRDKAEIVPRRGQSAEIVFSNRNSFATLELALGPRRDDGAGGVQSLRITCGEIASAARAARLEAAIRGETPAPIAADPHHWRLLGAASSVVGGVERVAVQSLSADGEFLAKLYGPVCDVALTGRLDETGSRIVRLQHG